MIPSNFIRKCVHGLTHCAACDTLRRNNKHLLTDSWSRCINREVEMQSRASSGLNGASAHLFFSTKLMSLRPGLIFCRWYCGQGNEQLNFCLLHKHPHLNMEVMGYQQLDELTWRESFHMTLLGSSTTGTLLFLRRRMIYCSNYFNRLLSIFIDLNQLKSINI